MKMKLGRHQWCVVIKLGIEKNAKVIICVELNPRAFNLLLGGNVYIYGPCHRDKYIDRKGIRQCVKDRFSMSLGIMKHLGQKDPKEYNYKHKSERNRDHRCCNKVQLRGEKKTYSLEMITKYLLTIVFDI